MQKVDVRSRRRLLDDFFKVDEAEVSFERFDGSMTPPVRRLVFERGDSVAAVVFDRDSERLLLTEQFRFPSVRKGPGLADRADRGHDRPRRTAARTHCAARSRKSSVTAQIGSSTSLPFMFRPVARPNVSGCTTRRLMTPATYRRAAGCRASTRISGSCSMSPEEARAALKDGRIADAKTMIGLQWFSGAEKGSAKKDSCPAKRTFVPVSSLCHSA